MLALTGFIALFAIQAGAQNSPQTLAMAGVSYEISLANASQHLVKVRLSLAPGAPQGELQLPVWNSLYQIRDFAQYINWVRGRDQNGNPLVVTKLDKSRWQVGGGGGEIEYEIFADQSGPFGAQANAHHAFLIWPRF